MVSMDKEQHKDAMKDKKVMRQVMMILEVKTTVESRVASQQSSLMEKREVI